MATACAMLCSTVVIADRAERSNKHGAHAAMAQTPAEPAPAVPAHHHHAEEVSPRDADEPSAAGSADGKLDARVLRRCVAGPAGADHATRSGRVVAADFAVLPCGLTGGGDHRRHRRPYDRPAVRASRPVARASRPSNLIPPPRSSRARSSTGACASGEALAHRFSVSPTSYGRGRRCHAFGFGDSGSVDVAVAAHVRQGTRSERHPRRARGLGARLSASSEGWRQPAVGDSLSGRDFDLTIGETPVNLTGRPGVAMTVNGTLPAPTLRWREGDT